MKTLNLMSALSLSCLTALTQAQVFPSKPVRIVIGFPAGGLPAETLCWADAVQKSGAKLD